MISLAAATRGRVSRPIRAVVYGQEGVGKSTFTSGAPAPLFLGTEDGTAHLDVARLSIATWRDLLDALGQLAAADRHAYRTVVIDSVDWCEPLLWAHICQRDGEKSIESYGYGRGYTAALDEWRVLLAALDRCAAVGLHAVLVGHAQLRAFKNPVGPDYDRYELKLHTRACALVREWADCVLFAVHEEFAVADEKQRVRGVSSGGRVIHCQHSAAFDAKNRYGLPPTLPLDWSAFAAAIAAGTPSGSESHDKIHARIAEMLERAPSEMRAPVEAAVVGAGEDSVRLARIASRLETRLTGR